MKEYPGVDSEYVFVNIWEGDIGAPIMLTLLNKILNNLQEKTGIRVYPHLFRHTYATRLLKAGYAPERVQHLLKQTLGDKFEELIKDKKYHDVSGKVVKTIKAQSPITEFIRRKMYLKQHIGELRSKQNSLPASPIAKPNSTSHSKVVTRLQDKIKKLEAENKELKRKCEALAGQVYRVHHLESQVERFWVI